MVCNAYGRALDRGGVDMCSFGLQPVEAVHIVSASREHMRHSIVHMEAQKCKSDTDRDRGMVWVHCKECRKCSHGD